MPIINWWPEQAELLDFLATQPLCMLGTLDANAWPSLATVAFSENSRLELMFGTSRDSRKYGSLQANPRVGVTVTNPHPDCRRTMQYQGVAREVTGTAEWARREDEHYAKLPDSRKFRDRPDQTFWVIRPVYILFSDCRPDPWRLAEFNFYDGL